MENNMYHKFVLNTGEIYRELCSNWKKYPRRLFADIEERLYPILIKYNKVTFEWNGDHSYIDSKFAQLKNDARKILGDDF